MFCWFLFLRIGFTNSFYPVTNICMRSTCVIPCVWGAASLYERFPDQSQWEYFLLSWVHVQRGKHTQLYFVSGKEKGSSDCFLMGALGWLFFLLHLYKIPVSWNYSENICQGVCNLTVNFWRVFDFMPRQITLNRESTLEQTYFIEDNSLFC